MAITNFLPDTRQAGATNHTQTRFASLSRTRVN
jgi:hypothetical protein